MLALMLHLTFFDRPKPLRFLFSLLLAFYFGCEFNLFFDFKKCPECYGDELCRANLTKSVFHGVFNKTQVVVKRKTQRFGLTNAEVENVILCPGVNDVRFLYTNVKGSLWSNLGTSIEPLLLKYFETLPGWSFPKYLGACGDLIVEENKGSPLVGFIKSDFKTRAAFAAELLKMAQLFTFGHPNYSFYFTDISLDNLVADTQGKVYLVDLDHVIISKGAHSSSSIHKSEILQEKNYAFSPSDICSHYLSDHNFFSVCKYLLSHPENGLLRDIPTNLEERMQLSYILSECTKPETVADRFSAGRQLESLLVQITKN